MSTMTINGRETPLPDDPDALLVDVGMPQRGGYEIARLLRERYGSARPVILAMSGSETSQ